ncbi:2-hydroxyacid dehydrogenase [Actinokineospora bangkokensis]|uniref:Phosphoglycerate dehydrogenase n=1 Tax=Actinokineospora bangkokensis TaxID=1193682 RepID=A0A1Q9LHX2_9PSEU|nr:2-hydroxyacid dehydrogenase [Actinokineospora bangkokensis]OLR91616.1 phosphoglycerate dehydrogenase [Actinokineospora bangkokensis]
MTTTVLVPDDHGLAVLSGVDGVRAVRYETLTDLPDGARGAQVLVPDFLAGDQAAHVGALPDLRLVQLLTSGADAWVGKVPEHVLISTCRGAHGGSSAEWVLAALLSAYRDLPFFRDAQAGGRWDPHITDTLQGKHVVVVGAGDLGRQVERRVLAFDAACTLVATTARPGVRALAELPDLLPTADVVVLVVPNTPQTRHLADAAFLARMPDGAVLVNVARGPVVDTGALLAELTAGRLRAALDVTDPEPLPADHPLWRAPGVLITPHVAGSSGGHRARAYEVVARQVAKFLAGEKLDNLVQGAY